MITNLSRNIKVLLSIYNLKQPEFGKMIANSSGATVSSWVKGAATPPLEKLIIISRTFDISMDTLIFEEVGKKKDHPKKAVADGDIILNDDIFDDPHKIAELVRWLTRNHDRLKNDAIYDLYASRVILEKSNKDRIIEAKRMIEDKKRVNRG